MAAPISLSPYFSSLHLLDPITLWWARRNALEDNILTWLLWGEFERQLAQAVCVVKDVPCKCHYLILAERIASQNGTILYSCSASTPTKTQIE